MTIVIGCSCSQLNVKLGCYGLKMFKDFDPSILIVSGGEFLVKNGQPVYANGGFNFIYACLGHYFQSNLLQNRLLLDLIVPNVLWHFGV